MSGSHPKPEIYVRPEPHDPENPFNGDLFRRRELAGKLTGLVTRMKDGCVMAVDAPWGEGKTWFGRNWADDLRSKGYSVAYVDAFREDHVEDPFLMICSEILSALPEAPSKERVAEAGRRVLSALAPSAGKILVNLLGRVLAGTPDLAGDISKTVEEAGGAAASALESRFAKRLDEYEADKRSVAAFAETLSGQAAELDHPLVVFIDELDRCRPDFAVKTVERVKHFFDVPGVVFVLLVNRPQMEASVRGVYGADVDAQLYLGKFVQFWMRLPKDVALRPHAEDANQRYAVEVAKRFGLPFGGDFVRDFASMASAAGLSLRDIERGMTLFSLGHDFGAVEVLASWPVFLKVARPDLFAGVSAGSPEAHAECAKMADEMRSVRTDLYVLETMSGLHSWHAGRFQSPLGEGVAQSLRSLRMRGRDENFLPWLFDRVDFNIQN